MSENRPPKWFTEQVHENSHRPTPTLANNATGQPSEEAMNIAIAQLRHLYSQMMRGQILDQRRAAIGLLGPAIETIEKAHYE